MQRFSLRSLSCKRLSTFGIVVVLLVGAVIFCRAKGEEKFSFAQDDLSGNVADVKTQNINQLTNLTLKIGFNGVYKNGFQTRVSVAWGEDTKSVDEIELETVDSDGAKFVTRSKLTEKEKKERRAETLFLFPKANGSLTVRLWASGSLIGEKSFVSSDNRSENDCDGLLKASAPARPIYVVIGDDKQGFGDAFAELRLKEERRPVLVSIDSIAELPSDFRSYEVVDRLFFTTSDPSVYEGIQKDSPQIAAIERWVERGGNLVILAGDKSVPLLASNGVLNNLSPGREVAEKTHEFRAVNSFITDLQNVKNLAMTGSRSNPYLQTPVISDLKEGSIVEMREAETPLLVARPVGLGTVIYFAGDLSQPPIANWSGRGRLLLKILGVDPDKKMGTVVQSSFVKRGFLDFSGQLRSALDSFDGVKAVPFSFVAVLMFLYLVVIAPLDWVLVKKVFRKPIATWLTFPLSLLIFAVIAIWIYEKRTPQTSVINQTDLVDVDLSSGVIRDTSWLGTYSPIGARYDVRLEVGSFEAYDNTTLAVNTSETDVALTPLTLSGEGIGGAEQKTYVQKLWDEPYCCASGDMNAGVLRAPMLARSSKSFIGRWTSRLSNLPQLPELTDDGMALTGSIVNPFNVPIYSAYIIYEGGAYSLGTLAPGATSIERGATRVEPMRVLNEHKSSVPSSQSATWNGASYNANSTRAPYILRTASFYDFGGGEENWGIAKRLQRDVDLSSLLRCGRAVVFGTIVDSEYKEYQSNDELGRKSADAIELEKYNKKIAAEQGRTLESAKDVAIEKYGACGSSEEFLPTRATWGVSNSEERQGANKRVSVVRLVLPLKHSIK